MRTLLGKTPRFPQKERQYLLQAIRYVKSVEQIGSLPFGPDTLPPVDGLRPDVWVVAEADDTPQKRALSAAHGLAYRVMTTKKMLPGLPTPPAEETSAIGHPLSAMGLQPSTRKKVIVTGCFDWLPSWATSGFFEEVSGLGDLYIIVGHDADVRLLKEEGHPLFPADERRYMAPAIRYVRQALISTGHGWIDYRDGNGADQNRTCPR